MSSTEPVLYVHAADDGGILTVDGQSGRSAWVTLADLKVRLDQLAGSDGAVLLTSEPSGPASEIAQGVLESVAEAGVDVTRGQEVHPDALREGGGTSLMGAAHVGAVGLVEDLIERRAGLEARDVEGFTALMYAANAGEAATAGLLLDAGADANSMDHQGSTPLMFAAQHGYFAIAQRLVAAGADPTVGGDHGLTASDFATQNGHTKVAAFLLESEQRVS